MNQRSQRYSYLGEITLVDQLTAVTFPLNSV